LSFHVRDPSRECIISFSSSVLTNDYAKTATSSKPESLICHSPDICISRNDYFSESTISSAVSTRSDREELSINNTESRENHNIKPEDSGNW
ncbi:44158_t:CDS:2, partial [Gigaspora margarita]